jgi:hypothetical protein
MSACEHCWEMSRFLGLDYQEQLAYAQRENWPCTQDTIEGRKLRAGQWWNEAEMRDIRERQSLIAAKGEGSNQ